MRLHIPDKNTLTLQGSITALPRESHKLYDSMFFIMAVSSMRMSGYIDTIPVLLDERLASLDCIVQGGEIDIKGSLRSHNERAADRNRLIISVLATEIEPIAPGNEQVNNIELSGTICKPPIYRRTPLGREICDLMLAVCRKYGRADYLPCIVWGRNAQAASEFAVGDRVGGDGRVQSREYNKVVDGIETIKTAFEVSMSNIARLNDGEVV